MREGSFRLRRRNYGAFVSLIGLCDYLRDPGVDDYVSASKQRKTFKIKRAFKFNFSSREFL